MLAFIHIEKSGGKTVGRIFRHAYGLKHCDVQSFKIDGSGFPTAFDAQDYQQLGKLYKKLRSISGHSVQPHSDLRSVCPDVRFITLIRNPIDKVAAHYNYQVVSMGKKIKFEDWVQDPLYRNRQCRFLSGQKNADRAIEIVKKELFFLGLTEKLDEALVLLKNKLGDPQINFNYPVYKSEKKNLLGKLLLDPGYSKAPDSSIRLEIMSNPEKRKLIEENNQQDLKLYRFVTEEFYPQQQEEYGPTLEQDVEDFRKNNKRGSVSLNWILARLKREIVFKPALSKSLSENRKS